MNKGCCAGVSGSAARDLLRLLAHGVGTAKCQRRDDDKTGGESTGE